VGKLKVVGLAFIATLILSAVPISAASGAAFQAAEYTAVVSGQQEGSQTLTLDSLSVSCSVMTLSGELTEARVEPELTPTYSECTSGGESATIAMEGCKYRLDANASDLDIVCTAEKTIKVTARGGNCEAKISGQNSRTTVTHTNLEGPPDVISLNANVGSIKYNKTKDAGACPFSGTGEKENGTLAGVSVLKGSIGGEPDPLIVEALNLTKLCQDLLCNTVFGSGTVLEGAGTGKAVFEYKVGGNPVKAECAESAIKSKTNAKEKLFLPATTSILSFNMCGGCTVVAANLNYKTTIRGLGGGDGAFEMMQSGAKPIKLEIKTCNGETCIYERNAMVGKLSGGEPATLTLTKTPFIALGKGSGGNCGIPLEVTNTYQFSEPKVGGVPKVFVGL